MDPALAKLDRIRELLKEINRLKPNSPEQEALLAQVRKLSAEYMEIVDSANKPKKPK
jgi:hypothetical protein